METCCSWSVACSCGRIEDVLISNARVTLHDTLSSPTMTACIQVDWIQMKQIQGVLKRNSVWVLDCPVSLILGACGSSTSCLLWHSEAPLRTHFRLKTHTAIKKRRVGLYHTKLFCTKWWSEYVHLIKSAKVLRQGEKGRGADLSHHNS